MERPFISFIISCYNLPESMLCTCIDSILALSLQPSEREIIVVDDGSENSPIDGLMKYGDDITYIRQRNQGLSEARNTGIQMATGEYLQFVDGDDLLIKDAYEHCLQIARNKHPEMVVFDFVNTPSTTKDYKDTPLQSGSHYMRHNNIHGTAWGYMFHRSILGDLRFTPGIYHEDEEFTPLLLLRAENMIVTNAKAYLYQQRKGSITSNQDIRQKLKRLNDAKGIILRLNTIADHLPAKDRTALQRRVAQLTMDYLYNIIRMTRSRHYLKRKTEELQKAGLYPLPQKFYTAKYALFRQLFSIHHSLFTK